MIKKQQSREGESCKLEWGGSNQKYFLLAIVDTMAKRGAVNQVEEEWNPVSRAMESGQLKAIYKARGIICVV